MIEEWGVKGVQVEEIYALDHELIKSQFQDLKIYGLIFLFKWDSNIQNSSLSKSSNIIKDSSLIYFAKQIVQNACATQAILSILMNIKKDSNDDSVDLGVELKNLKEFSMELPFDLRGMAIGNCEKIKQVHNSFSKPESIYMMDMKKDQMPSEDPFHFISLIPIDNHVYEFDGLEEGPIDHGSIDNNGKDDDSDWLEHAMRIIQNKISLFGDREIRFNLMALIEDRMIHLRKLADEQIRQACISNTSPQIDDIEKMIEEEQEKRDYNRKENKWRRVNFVPVVMQLLEFMAKDGLLNSYV